MINRKQNLNFLIKEKIKIEILDKERISIIAPVLVSPTIKW